ncbi:hypothetical protein [Actinomadura sp. HBU206391]|uniref:hypothetical protein n=1 Tax=Actinomadura sp. HBU206391 TaxID=2731692 RepID=UPI001650952C|nr:hypothetical protein [Actinomadura sp. HBU206391]MBC6461758.1 hypothetical protein [Actinomadura sp. HBU206391]
MVQRSHSALALLLLVVATGCSSGDGGDSGERDSSGAIGAPGAPGRSDAGGDGAGGNGPGGNGPGGNGAGGNGAGARGAPIRIPAFNQAGVLITEARPELEKSITAACGGTLCVRLREEAREDVTTTCRYVRTEPDLNYGAEVRRDTTIVLITGTRPCTPENPDGIPLDEGQTPQEGQTPSPGTP